MEAMTRADQYLQQINNDTQKDSIDSGEAVKFTPLEKMTSYDVNVPFTRNVEDRIKKLLPYVGKARLPLAGITLGIPLVTCLIKLAGGHLLPSNLLCQALFTLSIASVGHYVLAAFVIYALYECISLFIDARALSQSSKNYKIKFYNKDVDHINKCFTYIENHPDKKDLNKSLFNYILECRTLFNGSYNTFTRQSIEATKHSVEQFLVPYSQNDEGQDRQTGASLKIQCNQTLISNFFKREKEKDIHMIEVCKDSVKFKGKVKTIAMISVIGLHIATIFVSLSPLFILGLSIATSILTLDLARNGLYNSKKINQAIKLYRSAYEVVCFRR